MEATLFEFKIVKQEKVEEKSQWISLLSKED
jgi:hypothetical protein